MAQGYTKDQPLDTDVNLGGGSPSDYIAASQKATKTYVDNKLATQDVVEVSKLVAADGSPDPALAAANDGSLSSAYNFSQTGTADIFPQGSTNGLNARFERLFGDDKPANSYSFTRRKFLVNNFVGRIAGFEDSQASPYSFGGSPGGFSLSVPAGCSARSNGAPTTHFLRIDTPNPAVTNFYTEWTESTGRNTIDITGSVYANLGIPQEMHTEIRVWPDQSPGVNTRWGSMRIQWQPTTYPDMPFRVEGWYSTAAGDGTTIAATTGTKFTTISIPVNPGHVYRFRLTVSSSVFTVLLYDAEGHDVAAQGVALGFTFNSFKTVRVYHTGTLSNMNIDEIEIT